MVDNVYLNTLAADELLPIAKHLSKHSLSQRWLEFVSPDDREMLFSKGQPFDRAMREHFTHLSINETYKLDNCVSVEGVDESFTRRVIEDFGTSFVRATITDTRLPQTIMFGRIPEKPVTVDILEAFATHCDSIRRLALYLDGDSLLDFVNHSFFVCNPELLEHLELSFRCSNSFRLTLPSLPNLKILDVQGPRLQHLVPTLQANQKMLAEVMLDSKTTQWSPIVAALHNCANLRKVELSGDVPQEKYASLLESCGTRLEKAILMNMNDSLCERVFDACPNLVCDVTITPSNIGKLKVFGKHVGKLTLGQPESRNWEGLKGAVDSCTGITEIYCMGQMMRSDMLGALFNTLKTQLENLDIVITMLTLSKEVLDRIREGTGNLRRINLMVFMFEDIEALAKLLAANRKLEHVELLQRNCLPRKEARRKEDRLSMALMRHPKLRTLSLTL